MIRRNALDRINKFLNYFDCIALVGPRQVGKTTIAQTIVDDRGDGAIYIDLEKQIDRDKISNPDAFFSEHSKKLIVLDEIQRLPEIFQELRVQIDERRRRDGLGGKFLVLGSASMSLLRQASESLAGRISLVEMTTLKISEIISSQSKVEFQDQVFATAMSPDSQADETAKIHLDFHPIVDALWLKGGFPLSYLQSDDWMSLNWRRDFIQTYLDRDLPHFGFRVETQRLGQFWRMLASDQGGVFNAQRYAQSFGVSGHTIAKYLDILEKLLLVRRLQPYSKNTIKRLIKSPRIYIRDSGVLHALLNLRSINDLRNHSIVGKSWEGFVIETLIDAAAGRVQPYFYRTAAGAEVDLVLEFAPGQCWAIEIKLSSKPVLDRGFHNAVEDLVAERRILVYTGDERISMRNGVEAMPLISATNEIRIAVGEEPN